MSLFHYTDIAAVQSILTNGELWFTHMEFMNDKEELHSGAKEIIRWLELTELLGSGHVSKVMALDFAKASYLNHAEYGYAERPLFSCSFSRAENSLSQWRAYGGFAIELDRSALEDEFTLYDCVYSEVEKKSAAKKLGSEVVSKLSAEISTDGAIGPDGLAEYSRLVTEAAKFKNEHFSEEQEVRGVFSEAMDSGSVSFRAKAGYLVPYVKKSFNKRAIRAIHIGPSPNQELAEKSLRALVVSLKLHGVRVVPSNIPFRP